MKELCLKRHWAVEEDFVDLFDVETNDDYPLDKEINELKKENNKLKNKIFELAKRLKKMESTKKEENEHGYLSKTHSTWKPEYVKMLKNNEEDDLDLLELDFVD